MLISTPMYAISGDVPVRYIMDEDRKVRSEYLQLTDSIWGDGFDAVYCPLSELLDYHKNR